MIFSRHTIKLHKRRVYLLLFCIVTVTLIYIFRITLLLAGRDFIYLTRPIWDKEPKVPENLIPHFYSPLVMPRKLCSLHNWTSRRMGDRPRVIDAFIFSIELDILEIRLKELWEVVDVFVIVEADKTFTGKEKPLYFQENQERFAWASEKIVHFIVRELHDKPKKDFDNEVRMRGFMTSYIHSIKPENGDLIIVGDIDEIPYAHTIELLKNCQGYPKELHLEMQNYLYSFEFKMQTTNWKPHVTIYDQSFWYHHHHVKHLSNYRLADAGCHCSFCFRYISQFVFKMTSYSHSDRVTREKLLERREIQRKICDGSDIYDMLPEVYSFKDLISQIGNVQRTFSTGGIPQYLVENPEKFKFLLPGGCMREEE